MVPSTVQSCLAGFASSSRLTDLAVDAAMMEDSEAGASCRVVIITWVPTNARYLLGES